MDTNKMRLDALRRVMDGLTQAEFADRYDLNASYISQLLSGTRSFGERSARNMEVKIGLPDGTLSRPFAVAGEGEMIDSPGLAKPEDAPAQDAKESNVIQANFRAPVRQTMIEIPYMDTVGSMGGGLERKTDDRVIDHLTIDRAYLKSLVSFSLAENLSLITGYGDSMKPTFSDGDIMLVDRGVTEVKIDAVYVLAKNDEIFIKRLQRRSDGSFLMISDNKAYQAETITDLDRFEVLGRVIFVWVGMKL